MEENLLNDYKQEFDEGGYTIFIRTKKEKIHRILTDYMVEKRYLDNTMLISYEETPMDIIGFFKKIANTWPEENILLEVKRKQDHSIFTAKNGELVIHSRFYKPFNPSEIENDRNWIMSEYLGYSNDYHKMNDESYEKMLHIIECYKSNESYCLIKKYLEDILNNELDVEQALIIVKNMIDTNCKNDIAKFYQNLKVAKIMGGIVKNPYVVK